MTGSRVTCICMCIFTSSQHVDVQVLITSNFQRREDPQSHLSPAPWTPLTIEGFHHRESRSGELPCPSDYGQCLRPLLTLLLLSCLSRSDQKPGKLCVTSAETILSSTIVSASIYATGHFSKSSSGTCWNGKSGIATTFPASLQVKP